MSYTTLTDEILEQLVNEETGGYGTFWVTPELAEQILDERNVSNRDMKKSQVERLKTQIETGNWKLTGEPIKISTEGVLIDGQNRLQACLMSMQPILTDVRTGLLPESQLVMDSGSPRTVWDNLGMEFPETKKCAKKLAGALRFRYFIVHNKIDARKTKAGSSMYEYLLHARPDYINNKAILQSVIKFRNVPYRMISASHAAALHYMFSEHDSKLADEFFRQLFEEGEVEHDSILQVRKRLIQERLRQTKGAKMPPVERAALVIKAWNSFIGANPVKRVMTRRRGEKFPTIMAPTIMASDQ